MEQTNARSTGRDATLRKGAFNRPLECNDVEWVVTSTAKNGGNKMLVSPYVTAQTVMALLDEEFGVMNWKDSYMPVPASGASMLAQKGRNGEADVYDPAPAGMICRLSVWSAERGEWITREDGAPEDGEFPVKSAVSNALKRAAVKFGLGRELAQYPKVFIETVDRFIPTWAEEKLCQVVNDFNAGKLFGRAVVVLREAKEQPTAATNGQPKQGTPIGKDPAQLIEMLVAEAKGWRLEQLIARGKSHFEQRATSYGFTEEQKQEMGRRLNAVVVEKRNPQPATA